MSAPGSSPAAHPGARSAEGRPVSDAAPVVELRGVSRTYQLDAVPVPALVDIDLAIRPDCFTVISGASGSGKSTLLNLIGCIDRADRGEVIVAGEPVAALDDAALTNLRARRLGFIFQNFNLLPVLTAYENVEYPLLILRRPADERRTRVAALLDAVGLADKARHRPGELSGGQRQRVAIARALAAHPEIVLADEPTANLDSHTGAMIIDLMRRLQREQGVAFVFSSHDPKVLEAADDAVTLSDGRIVEVRRRSAEARR
jgi:putative ABC transport system ATP-binding protein